MTTDQRQTLAAELRKVLESRRDTFVLSEYMFEPQFEGDSRNVSSLVTMAYLESKAVSAACLRLLLDYCESDWGMELVNYCAGVFHGRAPEPGETAFSLLPEVQSRLSADRLGFGHIYGGPK